MARNGASISPNSHAPNTHYLTTSLPPPSLSLSFSFTHPFSLSPLSPLSLSFFLSAFSIPLSPISLFLSLPSLSPLSIPLSPLSFPLSRRFSLSILFLPSVSPSPYCLYPGIDGNVRTRYPIMPIYGEGSTVWKEMEALRDMMMDMQKYLPYFEHDPGLGKRF